MRKGDNSGFAVLSLIISLLIVALLAFLVITYMTGRHGPAPGQAESPIQRAKNVECLAQIRKIETQVQFYSVQHGQYPASLGEVGGLLEEDLFCPVRGNRYLYDAESGRVACLDHTR